MNNQGPVKAIIVVTATALVCSVLVTLAVITLQPMRQAYQDLERNRAIIGISGLTDDASGLTDREVVSLFRRLDARIVDLGTADFDEYYNPDTFKTWQTAGKPELSVDIPPQLDLAKLARRSRLVTVYLVNDKSDLQRMILPIYGQGMWSTLYGFIALQADLNTIAGITFYQQEETAGIGDRILNRDWQSGWRGRKLYDKGGVLQIRIGTDTTDTGAFVAAHQIDGISGATVTVDAVERLVRYWFGPHGFAPFLKAFRAPVIS